MPDPGVVEAATTALLDWVDGAGLSARPGPPRPPGASGQSSSGRSGDSATTKGTDGAAGRGKDGADVHVWLVALLPEQGLRPNAGLDPIRFRMRFLLATADPGDAAALDRLLSATTTGAHLPVFDEVPAHVWQSSGVPARPAFYVDVPARLDRPLPVAPRVTAPLRVDTVPVRPLSGVVLGPGGTPLAGLRVQTTDGVAATFSGADGTFVLDGLPAGRATTLRLSGRALRFHHNVTADAALPAVIRCEIKEA